jgi:hypothetical protein
MPSNRPNDDVLEPSEQRDRRGENRTQDPSKKFLSLIAILEPVVERNQRIAEISCEFQESPGA